MVLVGAGRLHVSHGWRRHRRSGILPDGTTGPGHLVLLAIAGVVTACGQGGEEGTEGDPAAAERAAACRTVENSLDRIFCFADLASEAGSVAPCDSAEDQGVRYQCYAVFAQRRATPGPCRRIPDAGGDGRDLRDACLGDVARELERPDLCEEVRAPGLRDSCFLQLFRATGDSVLCDRIDDRGLKSLCTGEPVIGVAPIPWTVEQCGFQAADSPHSCRRSNFGVPVGVAMDPCTVCDPPSPDPTNHRPKTRRR